MTDLRVDGYEQAGVTDEQRYASHISQAAMLPYRGTLPFMPAQSYGYGTHPNDYRNEDKTVEVSTLLLMKQDRLIYKIK